MTPNATASPAKAPFTEASISNRLSQTKQTMDQKAPDTAASTKDSDDSSSSQVRRRGFLRRGSKSSPQSSNRSRNFIGSEEEENHGIPAQHERNGDWSIGDDIKMGLG